MTKRRWSQVIILKSLLLAAATIFFKDGIQQTYFLMVVFGLYAMLVLHNRPYRHEHMDILDASSNMCLVLLSSVASEFADKPEWDTEAMWSRMMLSTSFLSFVYALFVWIWLLRQTLYPSNREALANELKTLFATFVSISEMPIMHSYKHGDEMKPVHEWLAGLGAGDLRTLVGVINLLTTELIGQQPSVVPSTQRLVKLRRPRLSTQQGEVAGAQQAGAAGAQPGGVAGAQQAGGGGVAVAELAPQNRSIWDETL